MRQVYGLKSAGAALSLLVLGACNGAGTGEADTLSGELPGLEDGLASEGRGGPEGTVQPDVPVVIGTPKVDLEVEPFNTCGCGEYEGEPQPGTCGTYLGAWSEVVVRARVSGVSPPPSEGVAKVELRYVDDSGGELLLSSDSQAGPDGETFVVVFDATSLPESAVPVPPEKFSKMHLRIVALALPLQDGTVVEPGIHDVTAVVDLARPDLEILSPDIDAEILFPFSSILPFEVEAGDGGAGLQRIDVYLHYNLKTSLKNSIVHPWSMESYSAAVTVGLPTGPVAVLEIVARDCVGNWKLETRTVAVVPPEPDLPAYAEVGCAPGDEANPVRLRAGFGDDSDARQDLLLATDAGVRVSWGLPGGLMADFVDVGLEGKTVDAAFADITGDGAPDILVLRHTKETAKPYVVSLLRQLGFDGAGSRKFELDQEWPVDGSPFLLDVADVDGDALPDVLLADDDEGNAVAVLKHTGKNGNGGPDSWFHPPALFTGAGNISWLKAADVNNDALVDLVLARGEAGIVSVFVNSGNGVFTMAKDTLLIGKDLPFLDVADFTGDGNPDVAVFVQEFMSAYSILGDGTGYFTPLAVGEGKDKLLFLIENMSGMLNPEMPSPVLYTSGRVVHAGSKSNSLVTGDFNEDGKQDVAICEAEMGLVQLFHGEGDGTFVESLFLNAGVEPFSLVTGHFNDGSHADFAVANEGFCGARLMLDYRLHLSGKVTNWCLGAPPGCLDEGQAGCDCRCACHCPTPDSCVWKCGFVPEDPEACTDPSPCEGFESEDCACEADCQCTCSSVGALSCAWEQETVYTGAATCVGKAPDCVGEDAVSQCGCHSVCRCGCLDNGDSWCAWDASWLYEPEPQCPQSPGCKAGECKSIGWCSGEGEPGQQCVCSCGCGCMCSCVGSCLEDGSDWSVDSHCATECKWSCHWTDPCKSTEASLWTCTMEIPMPVSGRPTDGRLKPEKLSHGDFDLDGLPDVVLGLQTAPIHRCGIPDSGPTPTQHPIIVIPGKQNAVASLMMMLSALPSMATGSLSALEILDLDGNPYPDLVATVLGQGKFVEKPPKPVPNAEVMTGAVWVTYEADPDEPPGPANCGMKQVPVHVPGVFRASGGLVLPGKPADVGAADLFGPDPYSDLVVSSQKIASLGSQAYFPESLSTLPIYSSGDLPECSGMLFGYSSTCLPWGSGATLTCAEPPDLPTGSVCLPVDQFLAPVVGTTPVGLALVDIDNDGVTDVIVANKESANLSILRGMQAGDDFVLAPEGKPVQMLSVGSQPRDVGAGDIDGDGWADIATALGDKVAVSWGMDGTSFLAPTYLVEAPGCAAFAPVRLVVSDVNDDGRSDVAVLSQAARELLVHFSAPGRKFVGPIVFPTGNMPVDLDVVDLNGDGCQDFLVANSTSRTLSVLINDWCFDL
jgi:hypothetical protein